jgi:hypothetical protein
MLNVMDFGMNIQAAILIDGGWLQSGHDDRGAGKVGGY